MSEPLLVLQDVRAAYGAIEVLHGLSLEVQAGEIVTIIGANGSGKTTTLNVVSGVIPSKSGRVRFAGQDITGMPAHRAVELGIAHCPEGRRIFSRLSVLENLELGAFCRRDRIAVKRDLERVFALFPILAERSRQPGGTLSGGEQQMVAVARALMCEPKLLLLDEPSLGLAPLIVKKIFEVIAELNANGTTVLLVEQNARMALELAGRGYVLEVGELTASGPARDLLNDARVRSAYLGE